MLHHNRPSGVPNGLHQDYLMGEKEDLLRLNGASDTVSIKIHIKH